MSKWRSFAKYKKDSGKVVFNLKDELKLGLNSAKVKLSDGKGETKYQFYVYVQEGKTVNPDEDDDDEKIVPAKNDTADNKDN